MELSLTAGRAFLTTRGQTNEQRRTAGVFVGHAHPTPGARFLTPYSLPKAKRRARELKRGFELTAAYIPRPAQKCKQTAGFAESQTGGRREPPPQPPTESNHALKCPS